MTRTDKRVVVTGAAGFIGSHLCERLVAAGWRVTGIDNFNDFYSPASKRRNLAGLAGKRSFRLVRGDIRRAAVLERAFSPRPRVVIHLAAMAGVRPSMERPLLYSRSTWAVPWRCWKRPAGRRCATSSSARLPASTATAGGCPSARTTRLWSR